MKTTITKNIKHSLLVEEDSLIALDKFLRSKYSEIKIIAKCDDGSSLETNDLGEILSFENSNFRKVYQLTIDAENDYRDSISITMRSAKFFGTAEFDLTSESDERAVFVTEEVIKRFKDMKPAYDWITRIDILLVVAIVFAIPGLLLSTLRALDVLPPSSPSKLSGMEGFNVSLVLAGVIFVVTYPIRKGIDYLFPKVFFLLGKQKKNFETILKWRNIIFVGIILAIITGVIGNALSQQLLGR